MQPVVCGVMGKNSNMGVRQAWIDKHGAFTRNGRGLRFRAICCSLRLSHIRPQRLRAVAEADGELDGVVKTNLGQSNYILPFKQIAQISRSRLRIAQ